MDCGCLRRARYLDEDYDFFFKFHFCLIELDVCKDVGSHSLLSLILDSNSDGKMKKEQRLFVVSFF